MSYEVEKSGASSDGEFATYTFLIKRKRTLRKRFENEPTVVQPLNDVFVTTRYSLVLLWKVSITQDIDRWVADRFPPKKMFGTTNREFVE